MTEDTQKKLIQLNNEFYKKVGKYFDKTRNYSWKGWDILLEKGYIPTDRKERVLDLGCGNGRFLGFLLENGIDVDYTGVDNSKMLLESAMKNYPSGKFLHGDILNIDALETLVKGKKYDLVTIFGVMHHVPSEKLRTELLSFCNGALSRNGFICFSVWDFISDKRFDNRQVLPEQAEIKSSELDRGDYLLDWRKGKNAYRYCHAYSKSEDEQLIVVAGLEKVFEFYSDGRSGKLNRYYVLHGGDGLGDAHFVR